MPTGTFGGFPFDLEIYRTFVDQENPFTDSIIASGILANQQSLADAFANGGALATTRFYNPLDPDDDPPLDNDGKTKNTPVATSGDKQSYTRLAKMKAWKATQFTRELTGADPMQNVASKTGMYWRMYTQGLLINTAKTVLSLDALKSHHITATGGVTAGLVIDGQQAALGDFANKFGLYVMHSKIFAEYQKLGLIDYNKYTITNALTREVTLPTINGLITVVNDRGTVTTAEATTYHSFLFGQGCFLQATPTTITPEYIKYDPIENGGVDMLFNKRQYILHPNGVSFSIDGIAGEIPTEAEFLNKANWTLKYDPKNVRMAQIDIDASKL